MKTPVGLCNEGAPAVTGIQHKIGGVIQELPLFREEAL